MPEWSIGAVSKTVVPFRHPGFESLSFRSNKAIALKDAVAFFNFFNCSKKLIFRKIFIKFVDYSSKFMSFYGVEIKYR